MMNLMRNCDRTTMTATMGGKESSIRYSMRTSIADIRLERDWPSLFRFSADPFHMRRDVTKRTIMVISSLLVAILATFLMTHRYSSSGYIIKSARQGTAGGTLVGLSRIEERLRFSISLTMMSDIQAYIITFNKITDVTNDNIDWESRRNFR